MTVKFPAKLNNTNLPYFSKETLENNAKSLLEQCQKKYSYCYNAPVPIEEIVEDMYGTSPYYIDFNDKDILGMTAFSDGAIECIKDGKVVQQKIKQGQIYISNELALYGNEGRYRFTLAHELGHATHHYVLFQDNDTLSLFENLQNENNSIICKRQSIETKQYELVQNNDYIEWQANYFAACLLMPKTAIYNFCRSYTKQNSIFMLNEKYGDFFDDMNKKQKEDFIKDIAKFLGVSKQAIAIRIKELFYKG